MPIQNASALSDSAFLQQFEALSLPPEQFNHRGHLRLGWICLRLSGLEGAVSRVCRGINAYACHLGAADKFHQTLTEALLRIMAQRMAIQPSASWNDFIEANPDLLADALAVVHCHYSPECLHSDRARQCFVAPDLKPID
ncbi:hypothetical protein [Marinobacterium jannaschii]|uniref:hypothetical protein n=1 Tax=Marinobacterium jannaschii TaxID=64970 RepID=UPI0006863DB2|nr:hypothetical protein [Marinobacterium jannaschii]